MTGGTGFFGKATVRRLIGGGHEVRCLARSTSDTAELEGLGCGLVRGDVTDPRSVLEGMRGCGWFVHLANVYSFWERDRSVYTPIRRATEEEVASHRG